LVSHLGFSHPYARIHVELLGPCYKTGRLSSCLPISSVRFRLVGTFQPPALRGDSLHFTKSLPLISLRSLLPRGQQLSHSSRPFSFRAPRLRQRLGDGTSNYLSQADHVAQSSSVSSPSFTTSLLICRWATHCCGASYRA